MAVKRVMKSHSPAELYVNRLSAAFCILSFLIITICVMRLEASIYHRVMYVTFDSLVVFVVMAALRWIVAKILTTYEEMDGGQG